MWTLLFLLFVCMGFTLAAIPITMGIDFIFHTNIAGSVVGFGAISIGAVLGFLILDIVVTIIIETIKDKLDED